jgi:hypothetical protein
MLGTITLIVDQVWCWLWLLKEAYCQPVQLPGALLIDADLLQPMSLLLIMLGAKSQAAHLPLEVAPAVTRWPR